MYAADKNRIRSLIAIFNFGFDEGREERGFSIELCSFGSDFIPRAAFIIASISSSISIPQWMTHWSKKSRRRYKATKGWESPAHFVDGGLKAAYSVIKKSYASANLISDWEYPIIHLGDGMAFYRS